MRRPLFARDGAWSEQARTLTADVDGVTFTAKFAWLSNRWTVAAVSTLALPVEVTIYVSGAGAAHGYWKNASVGIGGYFTHADSPALVPILIGERTVGAIRDHDREPSDGGERTRDHVGVHIHAGRVETTSKVPSDDTDIVADLVAIHRALAADHAAVLEAWARAATELAGNLASGWPPVLTVPRAFGTTTIELRWRGVGGATIELTADARKAKLWLMEREPRPTPASRIFAGRPFTVIGEIPLDDALLTRAVARAEILSITVRRNVTIRIAADAPRAAVLESVLALLGEICGAASEPYR